MGAALMTGLSTGAGGSALGAASGVSSGWSAGATSALGSGLGAGAGGIAQEIPQLIGGLIGRGQAKHDARKAREWAEQMRATAYQTMVKDLELAGLNPVLAVHGGSPASAPSSPMPSRTTDFSGLRGAFGRVLASAKQASMLEDQVATVRAGRREAEANADVAQRSAPSRVEQAYHNVGLTGAQMLRAEAEALSAGAKRKDIDVNRQLNEALLPAARAERDLDVSEFGQGLRKFRRFMEALPIVGGTVGRARVRSR